MGQTGGQEEANHQTHTQGQENPLPSEAHHLSVGIANQEICNQGRNAGGEKHGVHLIRHLLPLHQTVQHHTQEGGPDVQQVDAPGAEARCQEEGQGRYIVHRDSRQAIQSRANQAHQPHIQERSRIAAYREVIGGHLRRLRQDFPQAGKHSVPVWHENSSNQKRHREKCKQQLQKICWGQVSYSF